MAENTNGAIELTSPGREHLHTFKCIWSHPRQSVQDITAFQTRKMRAVIAHAYENIEYYRKLFDRCRIKPRDIRSIQDLSVIPVTSTQDYRIRPLNETLSPNISPAKTVRRATSGSSGRPFIIRRTTIEDHLLNFFRIRALQQYGVRIVDKLAHIRLISGSHQRENRARRIRQALGIYRNYPIDSMQAAQKTIGELATLQPDVIGGYPSVLAHIALYQAEQNHSNNKYRFILSGGESLPPFRRRTIEQGFGTKVFDNVNVKFNLSRKYFFSHFFNTV